jgi:DeoR family ulaG and ulaABCDEF operon transcriptional repressor
VTRNFYAKRMFMGAAGIGPLGLMEQDPLLVQAEQKLIGQAEELIVLVDSSKFENRSSLVLCPHDRIDTIITDDRLDDRTAAMLDAADVTLIVVPSGAAHKEGVAKLPA